DSKVLMKAFQSIEKAAPLKNADPHPLARELSDNPPQTALDENSDRMGNAADVLRAADERVMRFQDRAAKIDVVLAIQQAAQVLKGVPGRKTLVLVGSGFKFIDTVVKPSRSGFGMEYTTENPGEINQAVYTWKVL